MPANPCFAIAPLLLGLVLAACAAAVPGYSPDPKTREAQERAAAAVANAGKMQPDGSYALGSEEAALDCKKLSGRMQVRILQIRDRDERYRASLLARGMQSATTLAIGGSKHSISPDAEYARDRAQLEAYNRQLAEKGCKTYDLDAELRPKPLAETPRPVEKPTQP
jgi:hypothetical protein